MSGVHDISARLITVEEKLHFLQQTITTCRGEPLTHEALAGLAHIVSDLVFTMQEVRRDMDAIKSREEPPDLCPPPLGETLLAAADPDPDAPPDTPGAPQNPAG